MNGIKTIPISSSFKLVVSPEEQKPYSEDIEDHVQKIWDHCKKITDWDLYDGKVFQMLEFKDNAIHGNFIMYRYFYTQHQHPELKKKLMITLIGVTGILRCKDQILMAKRSEQVTQYPGKWEFAPSGGVAIDYLSDRIVDYEKQLIDELTQEVGMDYVFIEAIKPFLLIKDDKDLTIDIICHIEVNSLGAKSATYDSMEYTDYKWINLEEIPKFIQENSADLIPNVPIIVKYIQ